MITPQRVTTDEAKTRKHIFLLRLINCRSANITEIKGMFASEP